MKELKINITWGVPARVIYNAFLSDFEMRKCTRGNVKLEPKEGGIFEFYEGKVSGKFVKLDKNKKIVQKWKLNDWASSSNVEIGLVDYEEDEECSFNLVQTDIPDGVDLEFLEKGWYAQIINPLKIICGFPIMDE